ncbi:MAG TPA: ATP-binding protein, partial [Clostridia bacterium]
VLENIFNNAVKYSMGGTRVYADLTAAGTAAGITAGGDMAAGGMHVFTLKNISKDPLNISADEITEQFVRGDRARYTEGNGLGLYIAKNLTEAMGGRFNININGDLFEVQIGFKSA